MKQVIKKIIIFILTLEAKLVLLRFRPKVIAITGSVGKTTTKDAVYTALKNHYKVRKNQKSFNSEFGVPLTILGLDTGWSNPFTWTMNIILGFFVIFSFKYPEWLVLETGVDNPGDMDKTAKWLKPHVAIFTSFGTVPVHVENFGSPEELWREKKKLATYVRPGGAIILNQDDENVMSIKDIAKREVYTFGIDADADVAVSHGEAVYDSSEFKKPIGISFKLNMGDTSIPVVIDNVLGIQHMYPVAAALAVGLSQKMQLVDLASSFREHECPKGRMRLLEGINGTTIIDDSYNASPVAMEAAIKALGELEVKGRKFAVLGDMLELGQFTRREHKKMGALAVKEGIDYVCAVGLRSEYIAEEAVKQGMQRKNVWYVKNAKDAAEVFIDLLQEGDVILVKGSQGVRTEKVVKELLANKEEAKKLLVRQDSAWENR